MTKYRKKPVVIEAMRFTGEPHAILEWTGMHDALGSYVFWNDGKLIIRTLEGDMTADAGDWIIRGVKGELYPCKPDIFAATYEAAPCGKPLPGTTAIRRIKGQMTRCVADENGDWQPRHLMAETDGGAITYGTWTLRRDYAAQCAILMTLAGDPDKRHCGRGTLEIGELLVSFADGDISFDEAVKELGG
jgi:hypothetical protein